MDKRGTGLSDRVAPSSLPTLEERMDDLRAVTDAAGSERAKLFGLSEGSHLDRGCHELKGVPGEWQLYAAEDT